VVKTYCTVFFSSAPLYSLADCFHSAFACCPPTHRTECGCARGMGPRDGRGKMCRAQVQRPRVYTNALWVHVAIVRSGICRTCVEYKTNAVLSTLKYKVQSAHTIQVDNIFINLLNIYNVL